MSILPKGTYPARGVEGALATSKDKGTPHVQVIVEIDGGDYAGRRLRWDGYLTDGAAQRTMESLRHMGWEGDMLDDLRGITSNIVEVVVDHEERQVDGQLKTFPRATWINRLGGGAKISDEARMSATAARSLAERFKAHARGIASAPKQASKVGSRPATRTGGAPAHAPDAPDPTDDDRIPF